jgi:type I restriction enzyme S subunit
MLSVSIHRGVTRRDKYTEDLPRSEDLSNYKVCLPGDIVLNRVRAFQGAIGMTAIEGLVSPDYLVLRPCLGEDPRFLHHLFRSNWFVGEMSARLRGIGSEEQGNVRTPRINAEDFGSITARFPSGHEQRSIAEFLDKTSMDVECRIQAAARQAALLVEREASVLAKLQGQLPLVRLKHLTSYITSGPRGWGDRVQSAGDPFLRIANVPRNGITLRDLDVQFVQPGLVEREARRSRTRRDDILITITADLGSVGIVEGWAIGGYVSQHVALARPLPSVDAHYIAWLLKRPAMRDYFRQSGYGGTKQGLSLADVGESTVPLRTLTEQKGVASNLDEIADATARLSRASAARIGLIRARQQSLITAVVTGKIDVSTAREVA